MAIKYSLSTHPVERRDKQSKKKIYARAQPSTASTSNS